MPTGITSVIQLFVPRWDFPGLAHISSHSDSSLTLPLDVANTFFIVSSALRRDVKKKN